MVMGSIDVLAARALGALLMLGAFDGSYSSASDVARLLGVGDGRLWRPKLDALRAAGVVHRQDGMYTVLSPLTPVELRGAAS
jgi:hypothetical protein